MKKYEINSARGTSIISARNKRAAYKVALDEIRRWGNPSELSFLVLRARWAESSPKASKIEIEEVL